MTRQEALVRAAKTRAIISAAITNTGPMTREELYAIGTEFETFREFSTFVSKLLMSNFLIYDEGNPKLLALGQYKVASVSKQRVSPHKFKKVTMYKTEDGQLFESLEEARKHDRVKKFEMMYISDPLFVDSNGRVPVHLIVDWIDRNKAAVKILVG